MQVQSSQRHGPHRDHADLTLKQVQRSTLVCKAPTLSIPSAEQSAALAAASTSGGDTWAPAPASEQAALHQPPPIPISHGTRILRMPQLIERVGLQRSAIYERLSPKSKYWDPLFPRPVSLFASSGPNSCHLSRRTAVGWIEAEVETYLQSLRTTAAQF